MHIHILGICGTFMGGLALLAKQLGHDVTGSDQNIYPPMSTQLQQLGIKLKNGYRPENLNPAPDCVVIGNSISRGNAEVEAVLNMGLAYTSGPQWLYEWVLKDRWVVAVAGTHGKTTTSSMIAWLLHDAGFEPGFLIGGVPLNFGISARLGKTPYFVVEADEYDTAFFDKRSKFVHYRARTAVLNNLEYDHADIFPDLASIQKQFHHFVRMIPGKGLIISPKNDVNLTEVLRLGCWSKVELTTCCNESIDADWKAKIIVPDASEIGVFYQEQKLGTISWKLSGKHNAYNALSALAAVNHAGIDINKAIAALCHFKNVKRRLEIIAQINGIVLYDDFAHHPTAIEMTLQGLRARVKKDRIVAILEPRSNTMCLGVHEHTLADSLRCADLAIVFHPDELGWDISSLAANSPSVSVYSSLDAIVEHLVNEAKPGDHFVFMSNGSFGGIHQRVNNKLKDVFIGLDNNE